MTKVTAEAQAKQIIADVIETTLPTLRFLRENKLLIAYTSPHLAKYPPNTKESAARGLVFWAIDRETYMGVGYNTNLIPASIVPKNYGDLLRPELKGKIGFVSNETGTRTLGGILKVKGEEFVRKLKVQDISLHPISGRAMADLVMSGEVALSPTIFRDHAMEAKAKGAPIDWAPMEIVPANAGGVALVAQAPHATRCGVAGGFSVQCRSGKNSRRSRNTAALLNRSVSNSGIPRPDCRRSNTTKPPRSGTSFARNRP